MLRARSSSCPARCHHHRGQYPGGGGRVGNLAAGGHGTRRHRGNQPRPRDGWHLGVPAAGDPSLARIVVLAGHESTGGLGMTTMSDVGASGASPAPGGRVSGSRDRRGSWIPTPGMITTRIMELRKRRGIMVALILVTIGIPVVFL